MGSPFDSLIQVGIVKDDIRTLPPKLESNNLQIGLGRCLQNLSSGCGAPGKRNFLNVWMFADGLAHSVAYNPVWGGTKEMVEMGLTKPINNVNNPRGESSLID